MAQGLLFGDPSWELEEEIERVLAYGEQFLIALLATLADTAPFVLMGYVFAALVREFLPRNILSRLLGRRGIRPLLNAVGIGALLPICSCGTIPLGIGLVRSGASRGTTLSFMTSSPAISPVSLLLGWSLLGAEFMIVYIFVVVTGSLLLGALGNQLLKENEKEMEVCERSQFQKREEGFEAPKGKVGFFKRLGRALHWAFFDLGSEVSLDLLFGLTLAAAIMTLVPVNWVTDWLSGTSITSLVLIILMGIPVYTCSVPSIPVIHNLLFMGASPGVGLAYLIAGPATNIGELTAIYRNMGRRSATYYVIVLLILALGGGFLANHLLEGPSALSSSMTGSESVSLLGEKMIVIQRGIEYLWASIVWWKAYSGIILIFVLGYGAYQKIQVLFKNPCEHCLFWNQVESVATCSGLCWLKKTNLRIRRVLSLGRQKPSEVGPSLGKE